MADRIVKLSDDFWNVRGSLKLAGLLELGTQTSLVRRSNGAYVLLDSYELEGEARREILERTDGGRAVEAVLNLHPFHTLHVRATAKTFSRAKLYGTRRHVSREPDLSWEKIHTDDPELHDLFADDLSFSVPRGVDFIPDNQNLHFSSVLAFHPPSRTLHVDDTLLYNSLPWTKAIRFHPTLRSTLQKRAGAADEFLAWSRELIQRCRDVEHLCTAHMHSLPPSAVEGGAIDERVQQALDKVEKVVVAHRDKYG